MNSASGLLLRLKKRLEFGFATQEILDRLARIGVVIYPYFLVYEPILERPEMDVLNSGLRLKRLQADEAHLIANIVERPREESRIREIMTRADCVAIMDGDELLGYGWFTRQRMGSPIRAWSVCELPPQWAYLFDMYVRPKARGRNLAAFIRHRVQQMLAAQDVRHCCSITLAFNRPSRRFKAKLGARQSELRLLLRLGPLAGLDLRLRRKTWLLQTPAARIVQPRRHSL